MMLRFLAPIEQFVVDLLYAVVLTEIGFYCNRLNRSFWHKTKALMFQNDARSRAVAGFGRFLHGVAKHICNTPVIILARPTVRNLPGVSVPIPIPISVSRCDSAMRPHINEMRSQYR
jgi:hypothetical protein